MLSKPTAINFQHVTKKYERGYGQRGLRHLLTELPKRILRKNITSQKKYLYALRDINLQIKKGEALGIIGQNGAGKTTMLKLISKITRPTSGNLIINGRISALIELGAGFHPELSGRDNIFLNGAILGLTQDEINERFDKIVDFAELWDFIDMPVKRYSSGMYARLGFAVAAHTDPDILLVDEVLAVGDWNFQLKCFDFIHNFVNSGKTTVFVSHNLYAAEQLCNRLVWLEKGEIQTEGNPSTIVSQYLDFMETQSSANIISSSKSSSDKLQINNIYLTDEEGQEKSTFNDDEAIIVNLDYYSEKKILHPNFCIWVAAGAAGRPLFSANMIIDGNIPNYIHGTGTIGCKFYNLHLMPRTYYIWVEIYGEDHSEILFRWRRLASFNIFSKELSIIMKKRKGSTRFIKDHAPIRVNYQWII